MTEQNAIYCFKADIADTYEEMCEECIHYGNCDHTKQGEWDNHIFLVANIVMK